MCGKFAHARARRGRSTTRGRLELNKSRKHWKVFLTREKKRKRLTAAASAARLRLESAEARTDSGLVSEMRDVEVAKGRGRPPTDSSGLRRRAPADAATEADERAAAACEEEALAPLIVVVLGMEARMVAKSRLMLRWRMHGFGTVEGLEGRERGTNAR